MDFDEEQLKSNPVRQVQIDAVVLLKIMKHCRDHTVTGSGQLLGLEQNGVLEITNCFPVATKSSDDEVNEADDANYQLNMMRNLRQLNYDAESVGWYRSTHLGSHWNQMLIETQYEYQKALESAIVLLYDATLTSLSGSVSLKAMRLTDKFMKLFADKKFSMDIVVKNKLKPRDIFEFLPLQIRNSNLSTALLYQLDDLASSSAKEMQQQALSTPSWSFNVSGNMRSSSDLDAFIPQEIPVIHPTFDILEQKSTHVLEKHLEYMTETIDEYGQEQWRWHGWQRSVAKEQQKLNGLIARRKYENRTRAEQGMEALYGEEDLQATSMHLTRLTNNEPSRLESLIISKQLSTYCQQVEDVSEARLAKMLAVKALHDSVVRS